MLKPEERGDNWPASLKERMSSLEVSVWGQHLDSTSLWHPDDSELRFSGVGLGMHPQSICIESYRKGLLCLHLTQKL